MRRNKHYQDQQSSSIVSEMEFCKFVVKDAVPSPRHVNFLTSSKFSQLENKNSHATLFVIFVSFRLNKQNQARVDNLNTLHFLFLIFWGAWIYELT